MKTIEQLKFKMSNEVRTRRANLKMTQEELSGLSGISRFTIYKVEQGNIATVKAETIQELLKAINEYEDLKNGIN